MHKSSHLLYSFSSKNIFSNLFSLFILIILGSSANAQTEQLIKVIVSPNHEDWTYKIGEEVKFEIAILKSNIPLKNSKNHPRILLLKSEGKMIKKS